ncbi:MAG: endonuclease I [Candidatus Dormibacteria bacterium]
MEADIRIRRRHGTKRSGLEVEVGKLIEPLGFLYEKERVYYTVPEKVHFYLPDWELDSVLIETKGRFTSTDRKKILLVKEQNPELQLLMVFGRPQNTLSKKSKTTYGDWCTANKISWVGVDTFRKDYKKICSLLMKKKQVLGVAPILQNPKRKRFLESLTGKLQKNSEKQLLTRL